MGSNTQKKISWIKFKYSFLDRNSLIKFNLSPWKLQPLIQGTILGKKPISYIIMLHWSILLVVKLN